MSNYSTFIKKKKTLRVTYTNHKHCLKCVDAKQEETHKAKEGEIIVRKMSLALKKQLGNCECMRSTPSSFLKTAR